MNRTKIEWAEVTWNPVTGCTPVSPGCEHCYARRMATRFRGRFGYPADNPFRVTLHEDRVEEPLRWRRPQMVFVCSMGDLFHPEVPDQFIARVFGTMRYASHHTFMVLTKRPERMAAWFSQIWERPGEGYKRFGHERRPGGIEGYIVAEADRWPLPNVWVGVTVENQEMANRRIPILLQVPAAARFVSAEPLLGPVDLSEWIKEVRYCERHGQLCDEGVTWDNNGQLLCKYCKSPVERFRLLNLVIVGGETGPGARPMHPEWVRNIRDQCDAAGVAFFFKQWGEWMPHDGCWDEPHQKIIMAPDGEIREPYHGWGLDQRECGWEFMVRVGKKHAGRLLDSREWDEMPSQVMAP